MYKNKNFKKWIAPVSLASLLLTSQLPASIIAHAEGNKEVNASVKNVEYQKALKSSALWLYKNTPNAKFGNEDVVTDLAQTGFPVAKNYYTNYYKNIVSKLKANNGKIFDGEREVSSGKYGKVVLALTSIGKDASNIEGFNLIQTMMDKVLKEQENQTYSATSNYNVLYALDSANYKLPADEKYANLKEQMVKDLLNDQFTDENEGSFGVAWQWPGVDSTAMVTTALSNYTSRDGVNESLNKALNYLSLKLNKNAGYDGYYGGDSPESISQVILALTSLNINPKSDLRFIKNNNWSVSNLLTTYDQASGGFKNSPTSKIANDMSTDQANRALEAYDRLVNNEKKFYDMSDVKAENLAYDTKAPKLPTVKTVADNKTTVTGKTESYATVTVKNGSKIIGTAIADFKGAYSVKIKKQKAGTTLKIAATDLAKNTSKTVSVKVVDKTAPKTPIVKKVTKNSTRIVGTAEAKSTVYVVKNKKVIQKGKVSSKGKFSLSIKKQKTGTKLTVYVKDAANNKSASKTITVKSK